MNNEKLKMNDSSHEECVNAPKVFISYAHETPNHKNWVKSLATDLRSNGVDIALDIWEVDLGEEFTSFMETIRGCERVLLICTPAYFSKAEEGQGGVGYEKSVVTGELASDIATSKFICVLRSGESESSIPTFARGRRFVDFRDDSEYEIRLEELLRSIHNAPADPKPPLGTSPFLSPGTNDEYSSLFTPDANDTYQRAFKLLSKRDMVAWNRLVRHSRSEIDPKLTEWRQSVTPSSNDPEQWINQIDEGVRIAEDLIILAMTAIDSDIEAIRNQNGLLNDLLSPGNWELSGAVKIVEFPRVLGAVYHHLLGAFYVEKQQHTQAIDLLDFVVRSKDNNEAVALFKHADLMGFLDQFNGNCIEFWKYVVSLWDSRKWLKEFFHSPTQFRSCLRAYLLIASTIELCNELALGRSISDLQEEKFLDVPAHFIAPSNTQDTSFDDIVRSGIPNRSTLEYISSKYDVDIREVKQAWPTWVKQMLKWYGSGNPERLMRRRLIYYADNPPKLP